MSTYMYLLAAKLEFEALCKRIVHDGRDPELVASAMLERLAARIRELEAKP